jgi:hypothetical protein
VDKSVQANAAPCEARHAGDAPENSGDDPGAVVYRPNAVGDDPGVSDHQFRQRVMIRGARVNAGNIRATMRKTRVNARNIRVTMRKARVNAGNIQATIRKTRMIARNIPVTTWKAWMIGKNAWTFPETWGKRRRNRRGFSTSAWRAHDRKNRTAVYPKP